MQYKRGLDTAATTGPEGSYLSLLNPISSITGGVDRYPDFMADIFPGSPRTAWLVSKVGAQALLGLAAAGAARYLRHANTVERLTSSDVPVGKTTRQIGTTFTAPLTGGKDKEDKKDKKDKKSETDGNKQKKTAKDKGRHHIYQAPPASDIYETTANAVLPTAALMLGLAGGYALADKYAVKTKKQMLSEAIAHKRKILGDLISTRARIAKGTATDAEVRAALAATDDTVAFTKDAGYGMCKSANGLLRALSGSAGLLATAILTGSAIASFAYFRKAHPNNLEYEATEDGVAAYMKAKGNLTPITVLPSDLSKVMARIDAPKPEKQQSVQSRAEAKDMTPTVVEAAPQVISAPPPQIDSAALPGQEMRNLPEQEATRKPISITL